MGSLVTVFSVIWIKKSFGNGSRYLTVEASFSRLQVTVAAMMT